MQFYVYHIKSIHLRPYVQYILFIGCKEKSYSGIISSFANTNYCLGILKDKRLQKNENGAMVLKEKSGINSYISGIYLEPLELVSCGERDEICIDFTPLGFYHFFKFPAGTFILDCDILTEAFGSQAIRVFENVFAETNPEKRGMLIESFLTTKCLNFSNHRLSEALFIIHRHNGNITVEKIAQILRCPEKGLYRLFTGYFGISPKQYIRVVRFRKALSLLNNKDGIKLVSHAYESGFTDQCHFIKELKYFTHITPKKISTVIYAIQNTVWVGIR